MKAFELLNQFKDKCKTKTDIIYPDKLCRNCYITYDHTIKISYKQGEFLLSLLRKEKLINSSEKGVFKQSGMIYYFQDNDSFDRHKLISPPLWFGDKGFFEIKYSTFKDIGYESI